MTQRKCHEEAFALTSSHCGVSGLPERVRGKSHLNYKNLGSSRTGGERIIHAGFQIGNDMLMISDAPEGQDDTVVMGTQTHVSIHPDSKEEADRTFALLTDGGEVVMPMAMQFWGDYFGMCKDKFGIRWTINYHEEKK